MSDFAIVNNKSVIRNNAKVYGLAIINVSSQGKGDSGVFGDAKVFGNARIEGSGIMRDKSQAYGNAIVRGLVKHSSQVFGNAVIEPTGELNGTATIHGTAVITTVIYNQDISQ